MNSVLQVYEKMLELRRDDDYQRIRDVLSRADFTTEAVGRTVGASNVLSMSIADIPPCLWRTRGLSAHDTLVRLFAMGQPVQIDAVRQAVAPMDLDDWVAGGLLEPPSADGGMAPKVKLTPFAGLVLASDLQQPSSIEGQGAFVMPPGGTTLQLAQMRVDRSSKRTLDLGTGCGALALVAAAQSECVVATDKNPRAIEFSRFNARLNRHENVDCRAGSLFEPVAGERFDLILSNPPFVISPTQRYAFRDSGMRGDAFCRQVVRLVPPMLDNGGYCQLTANVAHEAGRHWKEELSGWFEGLGCETVVWIERTQDIAEYAMMWIVTTESQSTSQVPQLFDRWMAYFNAQGIEAVSYLLITMRRAGGDWTWIDEAPRQIVARCGGDVLRSFAIYNFLREVARDELLLEQPMRVAPDVTVEQTHAIAGGVPEVRQTRLHKHGGVDYTVQVDTHVAGLVVRCDGKRPLGELVGELAANLDLEPQRVRAAVAGVVRNLIRRAILLPPSAVDAGA